MISNPSRLSKSQRMWTAGVLGVLFICSSAANKNAAQNTVIKQVMIEARLIEVSQSMMMKIGTEPGKLLDEVFVKLPKKNLMQASAGLLPEGWDLSTENNLLRIYGPKVGGQPPYDDRGTMQRTRGNYTHVAISLGNSYVISNSLGNNISIQRIEECFPPDEYTEVQFGDYNWKAQQMTEDPSKSKQKIKKSVCFIPTHI